LSYRGVIGVRTLTSRAGFGKHGGPMANNFGHRIKRDTALGARHGAEYCAALIWPPVFEIDCRVMESGIKVPQR